MIDKLQKLVAAAAQAPSGDNTQPWRFVVDAAAETISLEVDQTRDPSPMNSGQRMARIAVGAALEGLLRTARGNGWTVELEKPPPPTLALLRLRRAAGRKNQVADFFGGAQHGRQQGVRGSCAGARRRLQCDL